MTEPVAEPPVESSVESTEIRMPHAQTMGEEIANMVTHGIGAALSVAGLAVLMVLASVNGTTLHLVALAIYGTTLVLLYSASTLYHAVRGPRTKSLFQLIDHAAIFLLIAGSYTPFTLISLGGEWGWALFSIIWALAIAGALFRVFHRTHSRRVSLPLYLAMGWLVLIGGNELWIAVGPAGLTWLVIGGLAYTGGVIFYLWERLPFNHAVWHLFVLAGSACHFVAVLVAALPAPAGA